jgi:hypothetical protein
VLLLHNLPNQSKEDKVKIKANFNWNWKLNWKLKRSSKNNKTRGRRNGAGTGTDHVTKSSLEGEAAVQSNQITILSFLLS